MGKRSKRSRRCKVIPLWNGAGTVKIVIVDADNRPADSELISKVKEHIEENRPIGAEVTVSVRHLL